MTTRMGRVIRVISSSVSAEVLSERTGREGTPREERDFRLAVLDM